MPSIIGPQVSDVSPLMHTSIAQGLKSYVNGRLKWADYYPEMALLEITMLGVCIDSGRHWKEMAHGIIIWCTKPGFEQIKELLQHCA
jgi:hypothetical protein